jgi:hypothetical protein
MYILVGLALLVVYPLFLVTYSLKEIRKSIPFGFLLLPIWFPIIILSTYLEQGYLWLRQREELYRGGVKRFPIGTRRSRSGVTRPRSSVTKPRSDVTKPRAVAKK